MNISINGKSETIENIATVSDLVEKLSETLPKFFVIEKNGNIIYKENYKTEQLTENDEIEVVVFAGGG